MQGAVASERIEKILLLQQILLIFLLKIPILRSAILKFE